MRFTAFVGLLTVALSIGGGQALASTVSLEVDTPSGFNPTQHTITLPTTTFEIQTTGIFAFLVFEDFFATPITTGFGDSVSGSYEFIENGVSFPGQETAGATGVQATPFGVIDADDLFVTFSTAPTAFQVTAGAPVTVSGSNIFSFNNLQPLNPSYDGRVVIANRNGEVLSAPGVHAPIPLPAAAWLLLGGLGALGAVVRKRRA